MPNRAIIIPAQEHAFPDLASFDGWLEGHAHLLYLATYVRRAGDDVDRTKGPGAHFCGGYDHQSLDDGDGDGPAYEVEQDFSIHVPGGVVLEDYSDLAPEDRKPMPPDGWLVSEWEHFVDHDGVLNLDFVLRQNGSPLLRIRTAKNGPILVSVSAPVVRYDD